MPSWAMVERLSLDFCKLIWLWVSAAIRWQATTFAIFWKKQESLRCLHALGLTELKVGECLTLMLHCGRPHSAERARWDAQDRSGNSAKDWRLTLSRSLLTARISCRVTIRRRLWSSLLQ